MVDAMAVLQSMKTTATMCTLADLKEAFVRRIENMITGFNEGRIIFDRYLEQSLKNKTRQKRTVTSTEYEVHPEMKLSMSLQDLLSSSKTKTSLTAYLSESLLAHFHNSATCSIIVTYDTKIKGRDFEEVHTHEEADTPIPNQPKCRGFIVLHSFSGAERVGKLLGSLRRLGPKLTWPLLNII